MKRTLVLTGAILCMALFADALWACSAGDTLRIAKDSEGTLEYRVAKDVAAEVVDQVWGDDPAVTGASRDTAIESGTGVLLLTKSVVVREAGMPWCRDSWKDYVYTYEGRDWTDPGTYRDLITERDLWRHTNPDGTYSGGTLWTVRSHILQHANEFISANRVPEPWKYRMGEPEPTGLATDPGDSPAPRPRPTPKVVPSAPPVPADPKFTHRAG